jgi:hypothetical protein
MMDWMDCDYGFDGFDWIDWIDWINWMFGSIGSIGLIGSIEMERLTELTPIPKPFTLMLPILITHDARAPTIQVRALETAPYAQNGAVRSKRRRAFKRCCALKTAP